MQIHKSKGKTFQEVQAMIKASNIPISEQIIGRSIRPNHQPNMRPYSGQPVEMDKGIHYKCESCRFVILYSNGEARCKKVTMEVNKQHIPMFTFLSRSNRKCLREIMKRASIQLDKLRS